MASIPSALLCAIIGLVLWTGVGWIVARRLPLNAALALPLAPALGWAVQNTASLALSMAVGLSWATIIGSAVLVGAAALALARPTVAEPIEGARLAAWVYLAAALLALAPAAAILPKITPDGVILAAPIFDHSKAALIDEIIRAGVPPGNPVFGAGGSAGEVAYYYLWHFGAAQLGRLTGASGWEADIAASWFTAFSLLCLMCGLALHFSQRALAPLLVLAACCTGSLRPVLTALFGEDRVDRVIESASGFAGWLFQTTWSPHHVQAAGCTVLACLLMARLAACPSILPALVLGLVIAAGFGSSIWVGGIILAMVGSALALALLPGMPSSRRWRFLGACSIAALGAVALSMPLILAQFDTALARGGGTPIIIDPFHVLGPIFPAPLRRVLDLPAYWLVLLVIELPVVFVIGVIALGRHVLSVDDDPERRRDAVALAVLAGISLTGGWLLVSTTGDNNDLGWRAVLPGIIVLTVMAAAGIAQWIARRVVWVGALAAVAFIAALPDGLKIVRGNIVGMPSASAAAFGEAPAMWQAVRRLTPPNARVASNPLLFDDVTPWPVNISWALLANRRSCFAGNELALAFAPLSPQQRKEISDRFIGVFAGRGTVEDVSLLSSLYGCRVALVTSRDGAWEKDPFATSPAYQLAETEPGKWRIYVATDPAPN